MVHLFLLRLWRREICACFCRDSLVQFNYSENEPKGISFGSEGFDHSKAFCHEKIQSHARNNFRLRRSVVFVWRSATSSGNAGGFQCARRTTGGDATGWREASPIRKGESHMCKSKMTRSPFMGFVWAAALLGLLAAGNPEAGLAQTCSPGMGASIGISGPYGSPLDFYIHVGQSAMIQSLATINTGTCNLTNVTAWLVYPDSSFQEILDLNQQASPNNKLVSLDAVSCPGDDRCVAFSTTYQVKAGDIGNSLAFTTNWPPSFNFNVSAGGVPNAILFQLAVSASTVRIFGGVAQEQPTTGLIVLQPCVSITKQCDGGPFLYGQPIAFKGIITNCSVPQVTPWDGDLFILSVADNPATTITFATTTSSGRTYDGKLTAGETIGYSGSYVPQTNLCGPFSDTVQVVAADVTGYTVTNTASTVCSITTTPCISVTKTCPGSITYGTTSYIVGGVVTNCGNVPLVGVTVVDDNGTPTNAADDITITIGSLPIGGTAAYSATNTVPVGCGPFTDTVVASAKAACSGLGLQHWASCTTVQAQFTFTTNNFGVRTNRFGFNIIGSSNLVIVVESCTNLAKPVWAPVATNTLTNGASYFSDPKWTNYPDRFYRLRSP
jgi:hypothetical protein